MDERCFEYEYRPGEELVLRFRLPKRGVLPDRVRAHTREAVKEGLLAIRTLFDLAIEAIERAEKAEPKRRAKIKVE